MVIDNNDLFIYQHALLLKSLHHENRIFDECEIKNIFKSTRTLFFRYMSGLVIIPATCPAYNLSSLLKQCCNN